MPNLKVLKHTTYLKSKHRDERLLLELDDYYEEIEPVYHRDGEYLLGDKCWFEVRGRAFVKDKTMFLFELEQLRMLDVGISIFTLLKTLRNLDTKLLSNTQNNLLYHYEHFLQMRDIKRKGRKNLRDFKARIKQKFNLDC